MRGAALPKKGPGRPKGSQNKLTVEIRDMVEGALHAKGGQAYLEQQADENPVAFMGLVGKCLPKDVVLKVVHNAAELSDDEIQSRLLRARATRGALEAPASPQDPSSVH